MGRVPCRLMLMAFLAACNPAGYTGPPAASTSVQANGGPGGAIAWPPSIESLRQAIPAEALTIEDAIPSVHYVANEVIVGFKTELFGVPMHDPLELTTEQITRLHREVKVLAARVADQYGYEVRDTTPMITAALLRLPPGVAPQTAMAVLEADPRVFFAEPNGISKVHSTTSSDPFWPKQKNDFAYVGAERANDVVSFDHTVRVAVIDTGFYFDHSDAWHDVSTTEGYDFVLQGFVTGCGLYPIFLDFDNQGPDSSAEQLIAFDLTKGICPPVGSQFGSHGTGVAGIIGAAWENGLGGVGVMGRIDEVNPAGARVTIIPIQALNMMGKGSDWQTIQAIVYAGGLPASGQGGGAVQLSRRADIVNMSFAASMPSIGTHLAVQLATAAGALLIAGAGNSGSPVPEFPAFYQEVVSVSSLDTGNDQLAGFSNFGKIDLTAPGVSVTTTAVDYRNCGVVTPSPIPCAVTTYNSFFSGTSAAAPHVTAIAALYKAHDDTRTNVELRQMLIDNAADWGSPGADVYFGAGLVQAAPGPGVPLVLGNGPRMAYLVHQATGEIRTTPVSPANGSFQFTNVPAGLYSLLAAVDADGDGIFAETGEAVGAGGGGALQYAQTRLLPAGTVNGTINFALDWPGAEQEVTNDSAQTATPIFPGFYVEVTTASVGDVDWFGFVAPATGIYHIWTEGRNTTLCREEFKDMNSRVRLYDDPPLGPPQVDSIGSDCADFDYPLTQGKRYYLQVESEGTVVGVKTIVRVDPR